MLKNIILFVLCFSLIAIPTYADSEVVSFGLKEAIDYAIANNPQLEALDAEIAMKKIVIDAEKLSRNRAKQSRITTVDTAYVKNGYTVAAAEMGLTLALAQKEKVKNKIAFSVTQSYFNYQLSNRLIGINDNALKLAIENKKSVEKKLELGSATEIEVLSADLAVERMNTNKNIAMRNFSISKENFEIALNYEKNVAFKLIDEIETNEFICDLDQDISISMNTRYDVLALEHKKNLDKLYFDITDKVTSENTASYKKANSQLIDCEFAYTNGIKMIKLGLKSTYNDVLNARDMLVLFKMEYDIKLREYDASKIKYSVGLINNSEQTDSLNTMLNSEVEYEKSKLAYKLAKEKYDYEIKTGI